MAKITREEAKKRLTICAECPNFRPRLKQCSICNCFMLIKIWVRNAKCPDKPPKW